MRDVERRAVDPNLTAARAVQMRHKAGVGLTRHCQLEQVTRPWPRARPGRKTFKPLRCSDQLDDVPGGVTPPFLEEVEAFQRRLVARDEQNCRSFLVAVDVLEPGTAGHCEIIEFLPVETLAIDDR